MTAVALFFDNSCDAGRALPVPVSWILHSRWFSRAALALGIAAAIFSLAITVRCYMPCPFGDEWFTVDAVAHGAGPLDWPWLFGQHNEHRLAIPRLLIWLDLAAFGGKNVSLFVEIWLVLVLHFAAVVYVLERFTDFSIPLRRTLEGIFAFCIFHPNQNENLTWAFQIGFVLPFAIATAALLATAFYTKLRQRLLATISVAVSPLLAALNMAGGLLIGPVALGLAFSKRLSLRFPAIVAPVLLATAGAYVWHFQPPDPAHRPLAALAHPKDIFVYILTYFGASWTRMLPHKERTIAFLSLVCLAYLAIRTVRRRIALSDFEGFCFAECILMLAVAFVTALGRLHFGVGQAFASRYQTIAMLYWASLASLVLIAVWRERPSRFQLAQGVLVLLMFASALTFYKIWRDVSRRADSLQSACTEVVRGSDNARAAKTLYATDAGIEPGASYLRKIWR